MIDLPKRNQITKGCNVSIETKQNQGTGKLVEGIVENILTSSEFHPHGIKVRLHDGQIGRVKIIDRSKSILVSTNEDLNKRNIPKIEDVNNEFKEFYQYDSSMENIINDESEKKTKSIEGIKRSVQERFVTAVCSFGNSYEGGFVYLGIRSDGTISGLEKDMKLGGFVDYNDSFANHIIDKLEFLLKDRVFITSKIQIKFRNINSKTICIIQILPADRPIYLHTNTKSFFVRGASPKAMKFDEDEQFKYIKKRFPNYE